MRYHFKQELSQEDYVAFVMNHLRQGLLRPINIGLFVMCFGYLLASPFLPGNDGSFTFMYIALGLLAMLVFMVIFARRSAKKRYESVKDEFSVQFTLTDESLKYELKDNRFIEKNWMDFTKAIERGEYIYIYITKNQGLVLVKRGLDEEIVQFVRKQLTDHVDHRSLKLWTEE